MDGFAQTAVTAIVSATASVVTTLAVFRSRLDVMDARRSSDREVWDLKLESVRAEVARIAAEGREHFARSERLQRATLAIVAGIAGKEGMGHRMPDDALTRFFSEESERV